MFSSIISFFKHITNAKYKKEKKETDRKVKQEEIKILKQFKNRLAGTARAKAKEAEAVKSSDKKAKKLKAQVWLLNRLQNFVEFLEVTFGIIMTSVILIVLCVAIIFIVVWLTINGILQMEAFITDSGIFKGDKSDECIQGSQVIENTNFDLGSVGQLSGTLTAQQQNIYRSLSVYQEVINGDFGYSPWKDKFPEVVNKIGVSGISKFLIGFMATETGLEISTSEGKNCLEYVTHPKYTNTDAGQFGFLGLNINTKLDTHAPEIADAVRNKYKPKDSYKYESDFVPYAIAIQATTTATGDYPYYGKSYDWLKSNESKVNEIMQAYNISEGDKDELKFKISLLGTSTYYHGGGLNEGLVSLWCALWSASSGFDNIEILIPNYDESTYRQHILGVGGKNNCTAKWGQSVTPIFKIQGEEISVILWDWVWKNCTNPDYFKSTAKAWLDSKAEYEGNGVILNGHYGLIAYLIGNKVVQDLGLSMPIVSGGNIDDCECYEGTTSVNTSNISGGNTVAVPDSVIQSGLIGDYTNYVYTGDVKGWIYPARDVWDLWVSKGRKYDSNKDLATIDGHYLIAVRGKFGATGDAVIVELEDGSSFTAIIADIKGSDAQDDWGHVFEGEVSVIEWEAYGTSASSTDGVDIDLGDWRGKKVKQITNYGSYLQNQNIFSGSSQENKGQSTVKFENFLFIGDSHTVQLNNNIKLESKGHFVMAAGGASQSQFKDTSIKKKTIGMEKTYTDVSLNDYDKSKIKGVVVSLGSNDRTGTTSMKEFLDELVSYFDVPIFVQRVFPLGPGYSNYQSATQKVEQFNAEIKSYCDSNSELTYIDALDGLVGTDGNLINGADDGLHLTYGSDAVKVRQMWYDNIKSAVEGSSVGGSDYLSTQVECIANETMGENHTIDYENGVNTLKNFLAIAMKPVGECMYSWGGGRDEYIFAKGVSPRWKEFYLEQLPKGSYNFKSHCPYPSTSAASNANGLDCSGFVGWSIVNNRETIGSKVHYTTGAKYEGSYLSGKGFGQIVSRNDADFSYLPGDVYYNPDHTWICIGPSEHGGCVFVHASPDGVQINGFGGGEKTAYEYMAKYWPDFLVFAKSNCNASSYAGAYDQFTWYILSEQDTSGKGLKDPDGFRSKTAEEILEYLFNPPTSSYSSVGTGDFINTKGQPQGIWNTKDGQKTTMDLINSMQVGQAWGDVSAGNMNQAFITRVKNFVPYMGDAVHAKDGNPTCANTDMAKRVLTETKFKVPYYHQSGEESWGALKSGTSYNSTSSSNFNYNGCHIFSFAFALSATQQRLINPPEALVIGWYGGLWADGMGGDAQIKTLKATLNLNVKTMQDGKLLGKADVDSVLDKNGVVIVYLTKPFSSGDYHWVVITERVKDNGVDKYKIWTSTKISQMFQLYTFDELYNHRAASTNWIRMGVMP